MSFPRYQIGLVMSATEARRVWQEETGRPLPDAGEKTLTASFIVCGRAAALIRRPDGKSMVAVALEGPPEIGKCLLSDFLRELLAGETMRQEFALYGRLGGLKGGKKGGQTKSAARAAASRANGKKGGRPRKNPPPVDSAGGKA